LLVEAEYLNIPYALALQLIHLATSLSGFTCFS